MCKQKKLDIMKMMGIKVILIVELKRDLIKMIKDDKKAIRRGLLKTKCIRYENNRRNNSIQAIDTNEGYLHQVNNYKKSGFYISSKKKVKLNNIWLIRIVFRNEDTSKNFGDNMGLITGYLQASCELVVYEVKM